MSSYTNLPGYDNSSNCGCENQCGIIQHHSTAASNFNNLPSPHGLVGLCAIPAPLNIINGLSSNVSYEASFQSGSSMNNINQQQYVSSHWGTSCNNNDVWLPDEDDILICMQQATNDSDFRYTINWLRKAKGVLRATPRTIEEAKLRYQFLCTSGKIDERLNDQKIRQVITLLAEKMKLFISGTQSKSPVAFETTTSNTYPIAQQPSTLKEGANVSGRESGVICIDLTMSDEDTDSPDNSTMTAIVSSSNDKADVELTSIAKNPIDNDEPPMKRQKQSDEFQEIPVDLTETLSPTEVPHQHINNELIIEYLELLQEHLSPPNNTQEQFEIVVQCFYDALVFHSNNLKAASDVLLQSHIDENHGMSIDQQRDLEDDKEQEKDTIDNDGTDVHYDIDQVSETSSSLESTTFDDQEGANIDLTNLSSIEGYAGDVMKRKTTSFLVSFIGNPEKIWLMWTKDLAATPQFIDFCTSRIDLQPLLLEPKKAIKTYYSRQTSCIIQFKPNNDIFVNLRGIGGHEWYDALDLPGDLHWQMNFILIHKCQESTDSTQTFIKLHCPLTKQTYPVNATFLQLYCSEDPGAWGPRYTIVDNDVLVQYPKLLGDSSSESTVERVNDHSNSANSSKAALPHIHSAHLNLETILSIKAYFGDPMKRTTMAFLAVLLDGSELWIPWSPELFNNCHYITFCKSKPELYLLLFQGMEYRRETAYIRDTEITEVKPRSTVYVSFRGYIGHANYDVLPWPDRFEKTYLLKHIYGGFSNRKDKCDLHIYCPLFDHWYNADHLFVSLYGSRTLEQWNQAEGEENIVVIDKNFVNAHPETPKPDSSKNTGN